MLLLLLLLLCRRLACEQACLGLRDRCDCEEARG